MSPRRLNVPPVVWTIAALGAAAYFVYWLVKKAGTDFKGSGGAVGLVEALLVGDQPQAGDTTQTPLAMNDGPVFSQEIVGVIASPASGSTAKPIGHVIYNGYNVVVRLKASAPYNGILRFTSTETGLEGSHSVSDTLPVSVPGDGSWLELERVVPMVSKVYVFNTNVVLTLDLDGRLLATSVFVLDT